MVKAKEYFIEVPNLQQLDATANINIMVLAYGVSDNFNIALAVPYKSVKLQQNLVQIM